MSCLVPPERCCIYARTASPSLLLRPRPDDNPESDPASISENRNQEGTSKTSTVKMSSRLLSSRWCNYKTEPCFMFVFGLPFKIGVCFDHLGNFREDG